MRRPKDIVEKIKSDDLENTVKRSARTAGIPYVDARYIDVPMDVLMLKPVQIASEAGIAPLDSDGLSLTVGVLAADEKTQNKIKELSNELGLTVDTKLISQEGFTNIVQQYAKLPRPTAARPKITSRGLTLSKLIVPKITDYLAIISQKDIDMMLINLLSAGYSSGASDIHIDPQTDNVNISFRIDGVLADVGFLAKTDYEQLLNRIKFYARLKLNVEVPQDGRLSGQLEGKAIDFRIGTMPSVYGESAAIRILRTEAQMLKLSDLGFSGYDLQIIRDYLNKPRGMVLSSGPTGSGKTTSLYAMLNELNKPDVNIITIEDPVEYLLPGVTQSQINEKSGYGFPEALRASLRHDPDIIMIGEIRDKETAETAFRAALTGHIAFSTFHAGEAVSVVPSMVEMGVRPFLASSALSIVIAQRLVRMICNDCRVATTHSDPIPAEVKKEIDKIPAGARPGNVEIKFFKGKGCVKCQGIGYKGQIGIFEVMVMSPEIIKLSTSGVPLQEIQALAEKQGMVTMEQDGFLKAVQGITTLEEVWRVIGTE